jgi:hypothetical protein
MHEMSIKVKGKKTEIERKETKLARESKREMREENVVVEIEI